MGVPSEYSTPGPRLRCVLFGRRPGLRWSGLLVSMGVGVALGNVCTPSTPEVLYKSYGKHWIYFTCGRCARGGQRIYDLSSAL